MSYLKYLLFLCLFSPNSWASEITPTDSLHPGSVEDVAFSLLGRENIDY